MQFAFTCHRGQKRKGTEIPYISHILIVAGIASEHGADEDEAIAALLHDLLEDTNATAADVKSRFGSRVADIVIACSDTDVKPKPPWQARKENYLAHLLTAGKSELLVSAADKLANVRCSMKDARALGAELWSRFNATREQTHWYYRSLADIFETRGAELEYAEVDGDKRGDAAGSNRTESVVIEWQHFSRIASRLTTARHRIPFGVSAHSVPANRQFDELPKLEIGLSEQGRETRRSGISADALCTPCA